MKFIETSLKGAYVVEIEPVQDERGFFARTWCEREFTRQGLDSKFVQCNISFSPRKGTLRGMHYQASPHEEAKLVRCTMGAIHDVIVDLRPDSPTFKRWMDVRLTSENRRMLYVPRGFAHGCQTLVEGTEVLYQISEPYCAEAVRGWRWNDPAFGIEWPPGPRIISDRDRSFPNFGS